MKIKDLKKEEIGEFYWRYINLLPEDKELLDILKDSTEDFVDFLKTIPSERWIHRYAPDKWSILEMIQHIIDTERIFIYRALCFARNEKQALPGFDHDSYVENSHAEARDFNDLINEFKLVRTSASMLFMSFNDEMLRNQGSMSGVPATARAIGFIMAGHAKHHKDIIKKRYLQ